MIFFIHSFFLMSSASYFKILHCSVFLTTLLRCAVIFCILVINVARYKSAERSNNSEEKILTCHELAGNIFILYPCFVINCLFGTKLSLQT